VIDRLLAYSSVENIGLILLGLGIGGPVGITAALLQAVNHSIVKSLMFCTTGNILMKYHTRNLDKIKGMLKAVPLTSILFILGGLALVGLPPLNTFISKFGIIGAGFQTGHLWLMIFLLLALTVIFAALMKVLSSAVLGEMPEGMARGEVKGWGILPLAVLGGFILMLGVFLPPQFNTLLNEAANIIQAGKPAVFDPDALINLTKILIP